jgi:hypothetical protein
VLLNGLLLALIAGAIGFVPLADRGSSAVEGAVRRYAAAVTAQDLGRAAAELAPASRAEWAPWIEGQLGNIYEVKGIGVRSPSLLDRLWRRAPTGPFEVTVVMDVNRGYPEYFYQPTTRVAVTQVEGRWYLVEPLLAPEAQR